jgi:hypothetical protein
LWHLALHRSCLPDFACWADGFRHLLSCFIFMRLWRGLRGCCRLVAAPLFAVRHSKGREQIGCSALDVSRLPLLDSVVNLCFDLPRARERAVHPNMYLCSTRPVASTRAAALGHCPLTESDGGLSHLDRRMSEKLV